MRYRRRTSNYLKRITLSDLTHMTHIVDLIDIVVMMATIDSGCSLGKEFSELIYMNS